MMKFNKNELENVKPEDLRTSSDKPIKRIKRIISSVIIAVIVWFLIVNVVNPQVSVTIQDLPVRFVGEAALRDRGFVVVHKDALPNLAIKIKGTRSEIISAMGRIRVDVDLSSINDKGTITVNPSVYMPDYVSLEKQKFSKIDINIEHCYEKTIPVVIKQVNDEKIREKGYIVKSVPMIKEVLVTGSKDDVNMAKKCLVEVDVSLIKENEQLVYGCKPVADDLTALEGATSLFASHNVLEVDNTVYKRHSVPLRIETAEEAYRKYFIESDTKSISQEPVEIGVPEGMDVPQEIKAIIPDGDYQNGDRVVNLLLEEIEGIYIPKEERALKIKVRKAKIKEIYVDAVLENIPHGMYCDTDVVRVKTKVCVTEDFEGNEAKAVIDCSSFKEGENKGKIKFNDNKIKELNPSEINIVLKHNIS